MVRPVLSLVSGFLGVIGLPIAALIVAGGHSLIGAAVAVVSIVAVGLAIWAVRRPGDDDDGGEGDDDGGGGGAGEGDGGAPAGPDWDAFDREREEWEHSSTR